MSRVTGKTSVRVPAGGAGQGGAHFGAPVGDIGTKTPIAIEDATIVTDLEKRV